MSFTEWLYRCQLAELQRQNMTRTGFQRAGQYQRPRTYASACTQHARNSAKPGKPDKHSAQATSKKPAAPHRSHPLDKATACSKASIEQPRVQDEETAMAGPVHRFLDHGHEPSTHARTRQRPRQRRGAGAAVLRPAWVHQDQGRAARGSMLWQRVESAVGQLKHHLGGDGPLSQSDQLALANHPLRMEAGPVTDQERLHRRKLLQARKLAVRIARRILEARPAKARAVDGNPPRCPGVYHGERKGTSSSPPVRGNALPPSCDPGKQSIHTS